MKLLLSSSPSSSLSSTSFDTRVYNSKTATTAGCIAGILRRILCSGTLPTHPSDQTTEETNSLELDSKVTTPGTPGLVARLMGLDSLPELGSDWAQLRPKNSVSRSRSMNSADRVPGSDDSMHRRVKSTTSFREIPAFLELESEEFFILSFENVSERRGIRSKEAKRGKGFGEAKQRREKKSERVENGEEVRKVLRDLNGKVLQSSRRRSSTTKVNCNNNNGKDSTVTRNSNVKRHVVSDQVELPTVVKPSLNKKKKKNITNFQGVRTVEEQPDPQQCTSEDASPVSVLDCGQFLIDPEVPISEVDCCSSTTSNSRRKLSMEIENHKKLSPRRDNNLMGEERKTEKKHMWSRKEQSRDTPESSEILDEICSMSETELVESNWVQRWSLNHEDFKSIGEELESKIFGQLVEEMVDQI
ncbi:uncharacterized protein LOC133789580 [Humulus lupulus]|uniref:uncharacterized protein LOC133789580 n=1 Tax=Humulus lupulus TaxID=3486 RepID=UPI002B40CC27|nr:uncharacterized protein LOC133789580 [Humulus lupulus]